MRIVAKFGAACVALLTSGFAIAAPAQGLRDPTLAPAAAGQSESGTASRAVTIDSGSVAVIMRNGVRYLVVGTRLFARGQIIGPARIERITETEVWLREGGTVRKVPIFSGVERRLALPAEPRHQPPAFARPAAKP